MLSLTAEEHAALIADCKESIKWLEHYIHNFNSANPGYFPAILHSKLKRQQIALASLKAEQEQCDYCNGTGVSPEVGADSLGSGCGSCCGTGKSGLYKALPVAVTQPVDYHAAFTAGFKRGLELGRGRSSTGEVDG